MKERKVKGPGWRSILGFCRAVKNRELSKDGTGLYDVEQEHQSAYCYLVGLYSEDMGERVLGCLKELHATRIAQVKVKDYTEVKSGAYRYPKGNPLGQTVFADQMRTAFRIVLDGGQMKDAASAVGVTASHLKVLMNKQYGYSQNEMLKSQRAIQGKRYCEEVRKGRSKRSLSREHSCSEAAINTRIDEYNRRVREGIPLEYQLSEKLKKLMGLS